MKVSCRIAALFPVVATLILASSAYGIEQVRPLPQKIAFKAEKAQIGRLLFSDPLLSRDKSLSCSSCHDPGKGGAQNKPYPTGVEGKEVPINAPTVLNAVFHAFYFSNGRAPDLKAQITSSLASANEMGMSRAEVQERIQADSQYGKLFREAYQKDRVSFDDVVDALAEYEKTLVTPDGTFDLFLQGRGRLSDQEREGYLLFKKIGCIACHNGVSLGGNSYQKASLTTPSSPSHQERGDRYELTKNPADRNRYKVPTLRNIALTAPYFHDGSAPTLEDAVALMISRNLGVQPDKAEVADLAAFLRTLTGRTLAGHTWQGGPENTLPARTPGKPGLP